MPVYPFLQSLFHHQEMSDEEYFRRGKTVNIVLSVVLLVMIFAVLRKRIGEPGATALTLITAFTLFMFRAGWFQAELLYYFLSFLLFILYLDTLRSPTYLRAAAIGVLAGVAHLTKASVLPGLTLFVVCLGIRVGVSLARRHAANKPQLIMAPLLVLALFLGVIYPYISTSKQYFGHYFYNVNSTFYMWYDSWDEAKRGTNAHGDTVSWPKMPADQIPSFARYLQQHTPSQIAYRIGRGFLIVGYVAWLSHGYLTYVFLFSCFAILLLIQHREELGSLADPDSSILVLFVALYFAAYLFLYIWYTPIAGGPRLTQSLFLPFMYAVARLSIHADSRQFCVHIARVRISWTAFQYYTLSILCIDLLFKLPGKLTLLAGN